MICTRTALVLLGVTFCALPLAILGACFAYPLVVYSAFIAMTCAFLGRKSAALRWVSAIVFLTVFVGVLMQELFPRESPVNENLEYAIASGDLELIKSKIDNGYSPNGWSQDGRTMLTMACSRGYPRDETPFEQQARIEYETLKILLENGASKTVNLLDAFALGSSAPIHRVSGAGYISANDQLRVLRLLINYGADVNLRMRDGRAPLHLAACYAHPEAVSLLLENGADMNALDNEGRTPLQLAVLRGKSEIAKLLRKHGADQDGQKMIVVDNIIISQNHLTFDYEVKNAFEHDIWVCDDMYVFSNETVEPAIEKGTLSIRLRFNFPYTFFYDEMVARYVRLSPGKTYKRSISVKLPVGDYSPVHDSVKDNVQDTVELDRATFEVGYFNEDLKKKLFDYIQKTRRKIITSDYACDMADKLEWLNEKNDVNDIICVSYQWEGIKQEQTFSVDLKGTKFPTMAE